MTLRARTLSSIILTLAALIVVVYALARGIMMSSFVELEDRLGRRNVAQSLSVVQDATNILDTLTLDWAAWDDTYAFVQDQNPAYIESNLVDETFVSTRVNFMIFVNAQGEIVYAKGYNFHALAPLPIPPSLRVHISGRMPLAHYTEPDAYHAGLLLLPEGPLLIASRPILTSLEEGPIQGALIMARFLDDAEIAALSETILSQFAVRRFTEIPKSVQVALQMDAPVLVFPVDTEYLMGYGLLHNVYAEPILVLEQRIPRDIYRQGLRSLSYLVIALLVTGVIFGAVMLWILERLVLRRLEQLSADVIAIGRYEDFSARVTLAGEDELARFGEAINQMLTALDQSQRRRAEVEAALRQYTRELESRNEELDAFAGTVAHDLKDPLTKIKGYSAILEDRQAYAIDPERLTYAMGVIHRAGLQMERIIEELLLLASIYRIEDLACSTLDMAAIIEAALDRIEHMWRDADVTFVLPEQWLPAWGYAPWIEEVWANYLSNAIKYGGVPPRIELGATAAADGVIRFWIRDNGAGLSPDEQARLFTPFTRLDEVRARGHGLGLSIVRRIVEKLGGEVGVDSARDAGSTFWFTLPAGPSQ